MMSTDFPQYAREDVAVREAMVRVGRNVPFYVIPPSINAEGAAPPVVVLDLGGLRRASFPYRLSMPREMLDNMLRHVLE